ncbi:MAG: PP2C family protein-serine/threonine phosphatase [Shimia sp.]
MMDLLRRRPTLPVGLLLGLLVFCLPAALWLDLDYLTERNLSRQNADIGAVIDTVRDYYGGDLVPEIMAAEGNLRFDHIHEDVPGVLPIPATFSRELADRINGSGLRIEYGFVSDLPFAPRPVVPLPADIAEALGRFRRAEPGPIETSAGSIWAREVTLVSPVIMGAACVACHNTHPDSRRTDWTVGEVRGVQVVRASASLFQAIQSFEALLAFIVVASLLSLSILWAQGALTRSLSAANAEIGRTNAVLSRDLEGARQFQSSLLPTALPAAERVEYGVLYVPAREVGGDLIDVIERDDGSILLVAADVSDKGVKAAFFSAMTYAALRDAAEAGGPGDILAAANASLTAKNTADLFVTAIAAVLEPGTGAVRIAAMGHHPALIRRADGTLEAPAAPPVPPMGLFDGLRPGEIAATIAPGDVLCLYTDGATDAERPEGGRVGQQGVEAVVRAARDPQALVRGIQDACDPQGADPFDDIGVVAVGLRGGAPS